MKRLMDSYQFKSWMSFLLLAAAIIALYMVAMQIDIIWEGLSSFMGVVSPFIWGFVIAYLLNMPRERIEDMLSRLLKASESKRVKPYLLKRKHGISIFLTYTLLIVIISVIMNIIVPQIVQSILEFVEFLPVMFAAIERLIISLDQNDALPFFEISAILSLISWDEILAVFNPDNLNIVFGTILDLSSAVFGAALAVISSIYFMTEGGRFKAFLIRVLKAFSPAAVNTGILYYGHKVNSYFKRYLYCQVLDAIILGILMTVVTYFLGVRHAFVIGPMLGFANLIPYFGSIIGTVVAIIIIMLTDGFTFGLICAAVMLIIQQIDANLIFPRLLGGSMKISPLLVIIAIAIGNAYYGVIGMIIAIPVSTVLKNILDDLLLAMEERKHNRTDCP